MENRIVLSLGTNIGDKKLNLDYSLKLLEKGGILVNKISPIYITKAWGFNSENDFLNQIILASTNEKPKELLKTIKAIEKKMGRVQREVNTYEDRLIDIDILFFNEEIINTNELVVPHPKLHLRNFILDPLMDINESLSHPLLKKTIRELKQESKDKSNSIKILT